MTDLIRRILCRLRLKRLGRLSMPSDDSYAKVTAIWPKPNGAMARAVIQCRSPDDLQSALRIARRRDFPLSVCRGRHERAPSSKLAGGTQPFVLRSGCGQ
jgi:FAD/FMN-containing dehydrogenase